MTRLAYVVFILSHVILSPIFSQAQNARPDTSFITHAIENTKQLYTASTHFESSINNGGDYVEYNQRDEEHPYFMNDDWVMGSVLYDNDLYKDVPLMYDLSQQKLIFEHYSSANKISLVNKKINRFNIFGHTFIALEKSDKLHPSMPGGFYDLLYDGQIKVLVRRQKQLQERIVSEDLEAEFEESNRYYIFKDKNYFPVKKKGSVLIVLADQKSNLKQFIRKSKIRFGVNREDALKRVAQFYDSLKK